MEHKNPPAPVSSLEGGSGTSMMMVPPALSKGLAMGQGAAGMATQHQHQHQHQSPVPNARTSGGPWAIVLELGAAFLRCGFAGESQPRHCIPVSHLLVGKVLAGDVVPALLAPQEWTRYFISLLHRVFFRYLQANPQERSVIVSEGLLVPRLLRNGLAEALFALNVPSVLCFPRESLTLVPVELSTALVVDAGFNETRITPIFAGIIRVHAVKVTHIAGRRVNHKLKQILLAKGVHSDQLTRQYLEDLKAKVVHCATKAQLEITSVQYISLAGDISIERKDAQQAGESLFEDSSSDLSIPHAILEALLASPIDTRIPLAQNLLLVGGTARIPGFQDRLLYGVAQALTRNARYTQLLGLARQFHVCEPSFPPDSLSWIGGSIIGCVEHEDALTISDFRKGNRLPDWTRVRKRRARACK